MDPKLLTEAGWKATAAKLKIKDNGLQKVLFLYENIDDAAFTDAIRGLNAVTQSANNLKKVKEVAAIKDAVKYLTDMVSAAQAELREVTKAKALAEKAQLMEAKAEALEAKSDAMQAKADEEAAKREAQASKKGEAEDEEEEEEEETGDCFLKLKKALQAVKLSKKPYYFLVCDAKPYGLIISKKDIRKNAQARKELVEIAGGSTRPPKVGECRFENGKHVFEMEKPPLGLARILQKWIKDSTGVGHKIMVGKESGEEGDEPQRPDGQKESDDVPKFVPGVIDEPGGGPSGGRTPAGDATPGEPKKPGKEEPALDVTAPFSISGSVGRGGKNKKEDVEAVQAALNKRAKAGLEVDGKCGPKTIAAIMAFQKEHGLPNPDGLIEVGKKTAAALAGESVPSAEKPASGGGAAGAGGAGKPGGSGGAPTGPTGGVVGAAIEAAKKIAKEIADQKMRNDQAVAEAINRIKQALGKLTGGADGKEAKKIKDELEQAAKQNREHAGKIEQLVKDLLKRKTDEAAEAVKKAAEKAKPVIQTAEETVRKALDWLEKNAPGVGEDPNDLAKRVAQEVAARKKQAEQAYNDAAQKLKKAIKDAGGEEGKQIEEELNKAYNQMREHIKKVEDAAKQLAKRKTAEAGDFLKKVAEETIPGFKIVEDQAEKALQWAQSKGPSVYEGAKDLAKTVTKEVAAQKKKAEDAYNDVIKKLKKEADDQLGDEGKAIKKELQDAYQQAQEHARKVAEAAKALAQRKTQEAAEALKKAAEQTVPGFQTVEDLSKKALDWWNS